MDRLTMHSIKGKRVSVGKIEGKVFTKDIDFEKHYYRNKDALGVDIDALNECLKKGVTKIVLIDKKNRFRYSIDFHVLVNKGFVFPKGASKYKSSFQPQQFLSIGLWRKDRL